MAHADHHSEDAPLRNKLPPAIPDLPPVASSPRSAARRPTKPQRAGQGNQRKSESAERAQSSRSTHRTKRRSTPQARTASASSLDKANLRRAGQRASQLEIRADSTDEDAPHELSEVAARNAPPWLVSLVFHTLLIILLALIYVGKELPNTISLNATYADTIGEQLEDDVFQSTGIDQLAMDEPTFALDDLVTDDPLASPPELEPLLEGFLPADSVVTPSIGLALSGREPGMKEALLAKYGGTAKTEAAVQQALEWLVRQQRRDGAWSLKGPYNDGSYEENKTAATAMALLALQGAGHTHQAGRHREHVRRGWVALLKMQDEDGNFFHGTEEDHRLYSQAQATIAICEIYGMTRDPMFAQAAQLAIDYAARIQSQEGGWRYRPGVDSDTSVTGWFVMGLQSALMAGLTVPPQTLPRVSDYLDTVAAHGGSFYKYQPIRKGFNPAMTAEGLLCRQYLGWNKSQPNLLQGADYLLENPVDWQDRNVYYWYYATQVLHHLEGDYWDRWNNVMRDVLPAHQELSGPEKGSWAPFGDRWGGPGGRLYVTCLSVYMLEVYYRHLPIYSYRLD